jgi:hypothetical protein
MNRFPTPWLQPAQLLAVVISFAIAGSCGAAVIVDFRGTNVTNPGPATATVTLSDLGNDPVTLSSPDQGGVSLSSAADDSFPENDGYTGQIDLVFQTGTVGAGGLANWDVAIDPNGNINGNPSGNGWGVGTGGNTNNQISGSELLLFTYDPDFSTTGRNLFTFAAARVGNDVWEIWHRTGGTSGELIISGTGNVNQTPANTFVLTDGDMFALVTTNAGGTNRLRTLTIDMLVVPEPAAIALACLALASGLTLHRRRGT